jgi:hypothetical protein
VSGKESTLAWCKRRAGECREDSIANSTAEDGRELAAESRAFAAAAKRLEAETIDPMWLDTVAAKAQREADAHPNAARRSYCEGQAAMARTIAGLMRGGK